MTTAPSEELGRLLPTANPRATLRRVRAGLAQRRGLTAATCAALVGAAACSAVVPPLLGALVDAVLAGVLLEDDGSTADRFAKLLTWMFVTGVPALPRTGMSALPAQLAATLGDRVHLGERVLDLGSGGGIDVLLSARRVGPTGFVYGLDMTDEMLTLARANAAQAGAANVEFIKGTIEDVPLPDASVDVVISNCVINLSPDKDVVLAEAYRVLRPGGRFAVSDIVLLRPLEPAWTALVALWTGCIAGALGQTEYVTKLSTAGFNDPSVQVTRYYTADDVRELAGDVDSGQLPAGATVADAVDALQGAFAAAFIRATKPA